MKGYLEELVPEYLRSIKSIATASEELNKLTEPAQGRGWLSHLVSRFTADG